MKIKRNGKIYITLLLIMLLPTFFLITNKSYALTDEQSSIHLELNDENWLYGKDYMNGLSSFQFHIKQFAYGTGIKNAFCTDANLNISTGTWNMQDKADIVFSYMIYAGMNHDTLGGASIGEEEADIKKRHFATQLAIWWYIMCPNNQDTCGKNTAGNVDFSLFKLDLNDYAKSTYTNGTTVTGAGSIPAIIADLYAGAMKLKNSGATYDSYINQAKVTINNASNDYKFHLNNEGTYYETQPITVTVSPNVDDIVSSNSYKLALSGNYPTGTILVDNNGKTASEFSSGDSFVIKVPANVITPSSTSISVSVTANGQMTYFEAYAYTKMQDGQEVAGQQHLTTSWPMHIQTTDTKTFTFATNYVKISKIDITDKKELPGATLTVYKDKCENNPKTNVISSWTSTSEPHYIEIEAGNYCLVENKAPAGYKLSTEEVTFEITNGTDTPSVHMTNALTETEISKQDATTGKELPGAHLVVKDTNGNISDEWDSTEEAHKIYGLIPGTYELTETIAPDGYELSTETVKFTVKEDGTVDKVTMENKPVTVPEQVPTGDIPILIVAVLAVCCLGYVIYYMNKKENKA